MTQYILLKETLENTTEVFETLEFLKSQFPNSIDFEPLTKVKNSDSSEESLLKTRLKTMVIFHAHFNKKGENTIENTFYSSRRDTPELQDKLLEQFALTKEQINQIDHSLDIKHLVSMGIIKPIRRISFSELELDIIYQILDDVEIEDPNEKIELPNGKYYNQEILQNLVKKFTIK